MNCMVWNPIMWVTESCEKVNGWCSIAAYCYHNWWQLVWCWWPCTVWKWSHVLHIVNLGSSDSMVYCHGWSENLIRWRWWILWVLGLNWIFWLYATHWCVCKFGMRLVFPWLHDVACHNCYGEFSVRTKYLQCNPWNDDSSCMATLVWYGWQWCF